MAFSLIPGSRLATASTTDARYADLLGDGLNPLPAAPAQTPEQIAAVNAARAKFDEAQRISAVPYGTPASQGGTAQGWQVQSGITPGATEQNVGGQNVVARAGDFTGPATGPGGTATWQNAGPVRAGGYDAAGLPLGYNQGGATARPAAYQDTLIGGPGGAEYIRPRGAAPVIGGPGGVLPGGTLAPVTTGNAPGSPATATQPATTGANPAAGGQYNPAAPGGGSGSNPGATAQLPAWLDASFRDAQTLAGIGMTKGAGGAAPRVDLANADVKSFLDEERARKGPSEAEALLAKATDRTMAQALGVASGQRGTAEDRARAGRQALSSNVATGALASQDVAGLRAKEDADRRTRMLQTLQLGGDLASRADQTGLGYVQTGANLQANNINAQGNQEQIASRERLAGEDQAWKEYMFGNLSAGEKEAYRQAQLNKPSFGEQAVSTGLQLLPAVKTIKDIFA